MPRLLLASIHDVSPRFEGEVDTLVDQLRPHFGERVAMLVVPNHWGDAPIVPGSAFATKLRRWADAGFEMFLHGYYHRDDRPHTGANRMRARWMTAGEGEFLGLTKTEAIERIRRGQRLIEDVTGTSLAGFVAPAWLYGEEALEALTDCRIPIAESHWRVWSPRSGAELARSPVITWASRTPARLGSSLAAASILRRTRAKVLRIGLHPPDVHRRAILRSVGKALEAATKRRQPARYSDLRIS